MGQTTLRGRLQSVLSPSSRTPISLYRKEKSNDERRKQSLMQRRKMPLDSNLVQRFHFQSLWTSIVDRWHLHTHLMPGNISSPVVGTQEHCSLNVSINLGTLELCSTGDFLGICWDSNRHSIYSDTQTPTKGTA